ncbi:MAG: hypothetical protein O2983_16125 [Planctomycetota bacterium]|nr:hypothetical protein [Planctomycetota bacterium]MDA0919076.1 hypothetical protein [Planctomycetota bacterium]MDA1161131.1 hypothetical protein [Planctomycetota bacterium]
MTGYTVHTGASKKFTEGWDNIFDTKKPASKAGTKKKSAKKSETDVKASSKDGAKKKKNKKKKQS